MTCRLNPPSDTQREIVRGLTLADLAICFMLCPLFRQRTAASVLQTLLNVMHTEYQ
jgi:hypothetical protein